MIDTALVILVLSQIHVVLVRTEVENSGTAAASAIARSTLSSENGSVLISRGVDIQIPEGSACEAVQMLNVENARLGAKPPQNSLNLWMS